MAVDLRYSMGNILSVLIFFIILIFDINAYGQVSPDGYISIDCGSNVRYTDDTTGLLWVKDGDYGITGSNGVIQNITALNPGYPTYNYEALQTFRYFPEENMKNRSKYCYELPLTTNNISFLVRAMFLHGNASELQLPIQFEVYVNASLWMELNFTDNDDSYQAQARESIFFSPPGGNVTYICLVPKQGVPFISSLELRQFDPAGLMYTKSFVDSKELFFTKSVRYRFGVLFDMPGALVRYPDDMYDRVWHAVEILNATNEPSGMIGVPKNWSNIGPEINSVPSKVMESAYSYPNEGGLVIRFDLRYAEPGSFAYGIFYCATNNSESALPLQIQLDTTTYPSFTITNQPSQHSYFHVLNQNQTAIIFWDPFVINAMEFYIANSILQQTTDAHHVYVVNFIKETLNMTSWQGDPCTPVPYNWIGCYLEYKGYSWLVNTLTLSHFETVSGLTALDGTAWIGENRQTVNYLSITDSNVDSRLFKSLLQTFVRPSWLISLNMSFNEIRTLPDTQWWFQATNHTDKNLTSFDLSYNKLTQIPCFNDLPYFNQMQILHLSNNMITGQFPDTTCFSNLGNLTELVLSNNSLQGKVPSSLSIQNLPSMQVLDISNNTFSGDFPSDFYFARDDNTFQFLNADNNDFSGVLDLNQWYQNLKDTSSENTFVAREYSLNSTNSNEHPKVFSFLNNKITDIEPGIEEFQPLIEMLIQREDFNQSGILLGGNPYCTSGKYFTQRYLCRSSFTDEVHADVKRKSKKAIIIGGALGGGLLLLCFIFFIFVIWRLSRKVYLLKVVERELATRRVQPPYYSYVDLKAATQNFHRSNFLGKGSFGVVHKGVLADGTTIAVKRLLNAKKKRVLNDFLNEVVLITGIKHRNLIQLKGCCIENEERILVYGFAENRNVEATLWGEPDGTKLSWKQRYDICVGVANGLTYLHEALQPRIIHRDIKPANILLDKNFIPKIADFGLAKGFLEDADEHVTQMICGTAGYFAPEYYAQGRLTTKVDVFSFGVVTLEIVSGRRSFNPLLPQEEIQLLPWAQYLQRTGSTLKMLDPALQQSEYAESEVLKLINIALMCVESDPEIRPTMSKVETMLLEDEDRMYEMLCSAFMRRGESNSSMDRILKNLMEERRAGSSTSNSSGSSSKASSSFGSLSPVSEERPLLLPKV